MFDTFLPLKTGTLIFNEKINKKEKKRNEKRVGRLPGLICSAIAHYKYY